MPLRDHFRPPLSTTRGWDEIHGGWPMVIVQHLARILPPGFTAEPTVHLGRGYEVDVGTHDHRGPAGTNGASHHPPAGGGVATAVRTRPTLAAEVDLAVPDEYQVRVHDDRTFRRLVAVIELVSPSNKHGPGERAAFTNKCAALLQAGVCVCVVDVVTTMASNLYAELLAANRVADPMLGDPPSPTYTVTLRRVPAVRTRLETWYAPLAVGGPLPPLLIWLDHDLTLDLDLEATYADTLQSLRIG
jgi:hypothetical protein